MDERHRTLCAAQAGPARWAAAVFLFAWLVGWALGEAGAAKELVRLAAGWRHAGSGALLPFGFLAFWLTGWTVGGLVAAHALARGVAGWDRVAWSGGGVTVTRGVGPLSRSRFVPREDVRDVVHRARKRVVLITQRDEVVCSDLGTVDARDALRDALVRALDVRPERAAQALPTGWSASVDGAGRTVLTHEPVRLGRIGSAVAAVVSVAGAVLDGRPGVVTAGLVLVGLTLSAAAAAPRRPERWVLSAGRVGVHRDGSGLHLVALERIELQRRVDGDGDEGFAVVLQGVSESLVLQRTLLDADTPERLASWVSARTQVPVLRVDG